MTDQSSINDSLATTDVLWNLEDLYAADDIEELERDITSAKEEATRIRENYYGKVASLSPEDLFRLVTHLERLDCMLGKLATYSFLNFTTQVDNQEAGALNQRVRELLSECAKQK